MTYPDPDSELGWLGHINPDEIHDFVVEEIEDYFPELATATLIEELEDE